MSLMNEEERSYVNNGRSRLKIPLPRSGMKKVARRATSALGIITRRAQKERKEISARSFRAGIIILPVPDVARLATFLLRLRRTKQFSRQLPGLRSLFLIFLSTLAACSSQTPTDKLRKEMKTVASWAATSRMVAEALQNGKVLSAYAARTFEAAGQNLQDESRTLDKSPDLPGEGRRDAQAEIARLQQVVSQLKTAAEGKDFAALSQEVEQLKVAEQSLKSSFKGDSNQQ